MSFALGASNLLLSANIGLKSACFIIGSIGHNLVYGTIPGWIYKAGD